MIHELKILPEYFEAVCKGSKTFEVRRDDRGFEVGDIIKLKEWTKGKYTGREITVKVTYILRDSDYCKDGYCILGTRLFGYWRKLADFPELWFCGMCGVPYSTRNSFCSCCGSLMNYSDNMEDADNERSD